MLGFIIYSIVACLTYYFGYKLYYDRKFTYDSDAFFQFMWMIGGLCWPLLLPLLVLWEAATYFRPKPASVKLAEREEELRQKEKDFLMRRLERADLEHENGLEPEDPPDGWVPKGDGSRWYFERTLR